MTFWGEHTTILGWYETLENIEKEIREIAGAINNGDGAYSLKYNAEIELGGFFGSSKIKNKNVIMKSRMRESRTYGFVRG